MPDRSNVIRDAMGAWVPLPMAVSAALKAAELEPHLSTREWATCSEFGKSLDAALATERDYKDRCSKAGIAPVEDSA